MDNTSIIILIIIICLISSCASSSSAIAAVYKLKGGLSGIFGGLFGGILSSVFGETDCNKYGDAKIIGDPLGPNCEDPNELYAGLCYKPCPPDMKRTAACTCSNFDIKTDCNKYGDGKPIGDPSGPQCVSGTTLYGGLCVKNCPTNYKRTAACTCDGKQTTTDCSRFGSLGTPKPECPANFNYWGGICYTDQCEKDGGKRTASCTCDFGPYQGVWTDCGKFGGGQACPPGYKKTAACSCQKGGVVTDCGRYGSSKTPTQTCSAYPNSEYYAGLCYKKCPAGWSRTAACTCEITGGQIITDCSRFGSVGPPKNCPTGRDYYGSMCYKGCPEGYSRTAACSCQKTGGKIDTNCDKYGSVGTPKKCPPDRDYYASACYKACPEGKTRTAACTCK